MEAAEPRGRGRTGADSLSDKGCAEDRIGTGGSGEHGGGLPGDTGAASRAGRGRRAEEPTRGPGS